LAILGILRLFGVICSLLLLIVFIAVLRLRFVLVLILAFLPGGRWDVLLFFLLRGLDFFIVTNFHFLIIRC
jgi:hypothetical protein